MKGAGALTITAITPSHCRCSSVLSSTVSCSSSSSADYPLGSISTTSKVRLQSHGRPLLATDNHYQVKATKYWNQFYKRHHNKFFKDRHYLEKDWAHYFSDNISQTSSKVVLEVGCGAGNTIYPLINAFPNIFVHACDFSPNAIALVKLHENFEDDRLNTFVCDATTDDLCEFVKPSSVDIVTLVRVYGRECCLVMVICRAIIRERRSI